jgi:anaerobic selenocysteine-containing dehydrogenase
VGVSKQQGRAMSYFRKSAITASLFAALASATPSAAATFDGDWNVQITSSNAACSSGASVSIEINNGQVASNSTAVTASGRVAEAGAIRVTLASGMKRAVGSGVLTGTSGSGTWRAALCSGTWTAQRM